MATGIINQIKVGDTLCDLLANSATTATSAQTAASAATVGSLGSVSAYEEVANEKTYKGLKFHCGDYEGIVDLNSKGNMAIESLSKHVNLEAAKGIQIKPTTNVIFDSSRRILAGNGNEVQVEANFDDYANYTGGTAPQYSAKTGNDEKWAQMKISARSFDLRCNDHGGIALQPCGKDSDNHENKIKFESSRTSAIEATPTYLTTGGKGLEFGTFNNLHTSIYTGDYRFKGDAKVYGVTRGTIESTETGKVDYPTQGDDFKDILKNVSGNTCVWDEDTESWVAPMGATWDEIVKVARNYADGKISGGGSVDPEIYATKAWVTGQSYVTKAVADTLYSVKNDYIKYLGLSTGGSLELNNTAMTKTDEEGVVEAANINIISNGNISITGGADTLATSATSGKFEVICGGKIDLASKKSVNFTAGSDVAIEAGSDSNIEMTSKKIKLVNETKDNPAMVEGASGLALGVTPFITMSVKKFDDDRSFVNTNPEIKFIYQNGYTGTSYYDSANTKVIVPIAMVLEDTVVYFADGTRFDPAVAYEKQAGYLDSGATTLITPSHNIIVKSITDGQYYDVEVNKSSQVKTGAVVHSFDTPDEFIEYVDEATWTPTEGLKELAYGDTIELFEPINFAELRELMAAKEALLALAAKKDDLLNLLNN